MKIIYIPIEIKARELISKLFFIADNINQDFVFFIGNKLDTRRAASLLGKGIYFYKSINWYDTEHIKSIKKRGNKYISLDEEGGATQSDEKSFQLYLNYRSSLENISLVDRIFTWGDFDFRGWCEKYEDYSSKIFETGSPRFDLWRENIYSQIFKDEIAELKKYSPFFFIPSTFISSYEWLQKEIANEKRMKKNNSKISEEILNKRINARKDSYKNHLEYIKIIKKLSKDFPDHKIIIKPHPTEKVFDWKKNFEESNNYYNVLVDNKYDLTSYIAASECVIFSESTAGIQSIMMGKKAISYNLKNNVTFRNFANKCAPNTSNYKTLLDYLKLKDDPRNNNIYKKIIESRFYMSNETSSKMIMNNIKNLQKNEIELNKLIIKSKLYGTYFWVKDSLKLFLIRIKDSIFSKKTKFKSYSLKMPGGIKRIEIERVFKNLKLINQVNIKKFSKSGYIIYKKNSL